MTLLALICDLLHTLTVLWRSLASRPFHAVTIAWHRLASSSARRLFCLRSSVEVSNKLWCIDHNHYSSIPRSERSWAWALCEGRSRAAQLFWHVAWYVSNLNVQCTGIQSIRCALCRNQERWPSLRRGGWKIGIRHGSLSLQINMFEGSTTCTIYVQFILSQEGALKSTSTGPVVDALIPSASSFWYFLSNTVRGFLPGMYIQPIMIYSAATLTGWKVLTTSSSLSGFTFPLVSSTCEWI